MGNSLAFSQPYIVDEYYSDDDVTHDSGTESAEDSPTPAPALDSEGVSSADTERSGSNTEKDAEDITPLPTTDFNDVSVEDTDSPPQVVEYLPEELITPTTSGNLMSKPGNVDTSTSSITPSGSNTKAASDSDVPSFPSSGGSSAAAVAALHENGRAPIGSQEEDGIDEHDLEAEQKRTLERLDSDLSTFEAVEQSILEASREFDKGLDGREPEDGDGSGFNTKSPAGGQGTASGIPRLQRPTSGRPRSESGNQHLQHENEMARDDSEANQMTSSAYAQVSSSAPSNGDDQLPPSPSTHQLVHSFSTEDTDGGANSLPGNSKRGVSPRRHSGIPVRQNSFHGSSVPAAAAYLLYQGESDSAKGEAWDRPNDWSLRPRATSTCSDRESDGDDLTISDLTGRARKSKKRSGIPAAWIGRSQGDLTPRSVRSGSPRSSEIIDISRPPMDRKVLDLKRWFCISRPQYKTSCGVSSLVSCWNFLFSTLGHGSLKPLTQETAMSILGFTEPFDFIRFGTHTGNVAILRWFQELNSNFRVKGKCYILYKPEGKNRTPDVTAEMALDSLQRGLRDPSTTFIYHCKNHYFCPIGFEDTPTRPQDAYKSVSDDKKESWILIGDTSKSFPPIQCKKWKDITTDLNTKFPAYLDIRREWRGVRRRKYRRAISEMVHCIMVFQKVSGSFCSPSGSLQGRYSQPNSHRPSRLPVSPGSITSRLSPPEALCECEEPGPVLEEEELGVENLDSSADDDEYDDKVEDYDEWVDEEDEEEDGEKEGLSDDGSVSPV